MSFLGVRGVWLKGTWGRGVKNVQFLGDILNGCSLSGLGGLEGTIGPDIPLDVCV